MDEREAMQQAIACARSVEGRTSPRPPVGAVLVRDNVVVGKGATSPPYGPHAGVMHLTRWEPGRMARISIQRLSHAVSLSTHRHVPERSLTRVYGA